jgi:hypothetical protein
MEHALMSMMACLAVNGPSRVNRGVELGTRVVVLEIHGVSLEIHCVALGNHGVLTLPCSSAMVSLASRVAASAPAVSTMSAVQRELLRAEQKLLALPSGSFRSASLSNAAALKMHHCKGLQSGSPSTFHDWRRMTSFGEPTIDAQCQVPADL